MDRAVATKFKPQVRAKIRKMRSDGATIPEIAQKFETTTTLIRRVLEGK